MNTRIKEIRKSFGLTQEQFGRQIGSARNTIANYEIGNRKPSNAVITSICKEFNINEKWLRTGEGERQKYTKLNDYNEIAMNIAKHDEKARQAIITYWNLSQKDKDLFWDFTETFLRKNN